MKTAQELYPDCFVSSGYDGPCSYQTMLDDFGKIIIQVDDHDYTGDSRVLYNDGERYGWLQFGWGSCSGCDALQACSSYEGVQKLMDDLVSRIKWFDNAKDALKFFREHDWEADYSWNGEEQKKFVKQCVEMFEKLCE